MQAVSDSGCSRTMAAHLLAHHALLQRAELERSAAYACASEGQNNGFEDVRSAKGPNQGQNLALTGLFVPSWLDSVQGTPLIRKRHLLGN